MRKLLIILALFFIVSYPVWAGYKTIYNTFTGKMDYVNYFDGVNHTAAVFNNSGAYTFLGVNTSFLNVTGQSTFTGNIFLGGNIEYLGDSNTNIGHSADQFNFATGGSSRFTINNAGLRSTGHLNMTGNNISAVNHYYGTGNINTTGNITASNLIPWDFNYTVVNVTVTSNTVYDTAFLLNLPSTGYVFVDCMIWMKTAAMTTGAQFNLTVTGGTVNIYQVTYMNSTGTDQCDGVGATHVCAATSSRGGDMTRTFISVYSVRESAGSLRVNLKSEVSSSAVKIMEGSYCKTVPRPV